MIGTKYKQNQLTKYEGDRRLTCTNAQGLNMEIVQTPKRSAEARTTLRTRAN